MITEFLADSGDYHVTVADHSAAALAEVAAHASVATLELDVTDAAALAGALTGKFALLSAVPFCSPATSPTARPAPESIISI